MELFLKVLGTAILLSVFMLMIYCLSKHQANKNFQRFMKPGDWCKWMSDIDGDRWQIQYLVNGRAVIWNPMTEEVEVANIDDLFV